MNKFGVIAIAALSVLASVVAVGERHAMAHLEQGAPAPDFMLRAAQGGDVTTVDLKAALAKGPVVLYFFPKSFTKGCTVEAHLFSEHVEDYKRLGAQVIGVSGDDIETQRKFSTMECRSAFLVASDPGLKVAKEYRAALTSTYANRTSYLIAATPRRVRSLLGRHRDPAGTIVYAYTSLDPDKHVENTLAALQSLKLR